MRRAFPFVVGSGLLLAAGVGLPGCAPKPGGTAPGGPPNVTVSYPLQQTITDYGEYTGRTAAVDAVQIRARVSGYLDKINFTEGAEVKRGEVLYEIDPRPYKAALDQAQAQVRLQQAQRTYQEAVYRRNVRLQKEGQAVSLEDVQQSLAQRNTTQAQVEAAQAAAETAELNLGWTKVKAPIAGRIGRTLVTRGNLVAADQTLLTTLVSQDPMYAYFDVDEPTVLRVQALIREGKLPSVRQKGAHIPVFLGLADEPDYPHEGFLDFVSNQVEGTTATLQLRGVFANPMPSTGPRLLSPGLFVRIRVAVSPPYPALLVVQDAVGTDQDLKFVYVLDDKNKVVRRDVTLGSEHGGMQVIQKGVGPEDRVLVNGLQHVHPGDVVNPQLVPMPVPRPGQLPQTPPAVLKEAVPPQQKP
ncbi:MAG TPA: efflux RND transporter periplasmic adaptor subunit [Gemmataceae bacterium]|nr:efflux RND transporter periplasmic adaptor subunit [Gemmataceae bacterium]